MRGYRLTRRATEDLDAIWEYIATEASPDRADRVIEVLRAAVRNLAAHPGIGHRRDDIAEESLRIWTVHPYLIIYRTNQRPIHVLRFIHGSRDLLRLFEQPP